MSDRALAPIEVVCPNCGRRNDAATDIEDPNIKPRVGDVGVCYGCTEVFFYTEFGAQQMTHEQHRAAVHDPTIVAAQITIRLSKRMKGL